MSNLSSLHFLELVLSNVVLDLKIAPIFLCVHCFLCYIKNESFYLCQSERLFEWRCSKCVGGRIMCLCFLSHYFLLFVVTAYICLEMYYMPPWWKKCIQSLWS